VENLAITKFFNSVNPDAANPTPEIVAVAARYVLPVIVPNPVSYPPINFIVE
jgi:hypothetical protein